ncbi:MAG: alanine-zipper protein [Nitrococcus sp.]|nr:alanine-zipper protein [Nitrococcus sp.]
MSRTLNTTLKLSATVLSLFFVVGCATEAAVQDAAQGGLADTTDQAGQAMQALQAAQDAQAQAEAALEAATAAQAMAQEAQGMAQSAQFSADQNSQKIDRMFKTSMHK